MASPSAIHICEAGHEDFDAVMAISDNIYDGLDYLPTLYHTLLQDPDAHLFVAEINGKVVGFKIMYLLENGRTVLSMSARTGSGQRGQGIQYELGKTCKEIMMNKFPGIEVLTWTAVSGGSKLEKLEHDGTRLMRRWNFIPFKSMGHILKCSNTLKHPHPSLPVEKVIKLTADDATKLAEDDHFRENIILEERFWAGVDWRPYKKSRTNLRSVLLQNQLYGTQSLDINGRKQWNSLSYSLALKVPYGVVCHVSFYCSNTQELLSHLVKQMQHLSTIVTPSTPTSFILFFPKHLDYKQVLDFLHPDFGEPQLTPNLPYHDCIIAEQDVKSKL